MGFIVDITAVSLRRAISWRTNRFAKGDLNGVMAAYPHVAEWVRDFEMRYGSRPIYYGPLDRLRR